MDFFSLSLMKMIEYGNLLFNIENLVIKKLIDYNLQRKKKGKVLAFPIICEINKSLGYAFPHELHFFKS